MLSILAVIVIAVITDVISNLIIEWLHSNRHK